MKYDVLGVKIDKVTMPQAIDQVVEWASQKLEVRTHSLDRGEKPSSDNSALSSKHYVVTPNVEFLMLAQKDAEFKKILNEANLAIPDSARLSWAYKITHTKNPLLKLLYWPTFLLPPTGQVNQFDIVTGTDLMEQLISVSSEKGFTIGLLGGQEKLADKLLQVLIKKYPGLKISYASSDVVVDSEGNLLKESKSQRVRESEPHLTLDIPQTDILFVALGQGKQEKWIAKNLNVQPVKVMIGVGGAFDYLSGEVPRAPKLMRQLGLEWLYRITLQPWRAKRFIALFEFLFVVLTKKS